MSSLSDFVGNILFFFCCQKNIQPNFAYTFDFDTKYKSIKVKVKM